jgi:hypothetical protein
MPLKRTIFKSNPVVQYLANIIIIIILLSLKGTNRCVCGWVWQQAGRQARQARHQNENED